MSKVTSILVAAFIWLAAFGMTTGSAQAQVYDSSPGDVVPPEILSAISNETIDLLIDLTSGEIVSNPSPSGPGGFRLTADLSNPFTINDSNNIRDFNVSFFPGQSIRLGDFVARNDDGSLLNGGFCEFVQITFNGTGGSAIGSGGMKFLGVKGDLKTNPASAFANGQFGITTDWCNADLTDSFFEYSGFSVTDYNFSLSAAPGEFTAANFFVFSDNVEVLLADVPEPGTMALFGIGLVGLAAARRRRKAA